MRPLQRDPVAPITIAHPHENLAAAKLQLSAADLKYLEGVATGAARAKHGGASGAPLRSGVASPDHGYGRRLVLGRRGRRATLYEHNTLLQVVVHLVVEFPVAL